MSLKTICVFSLSANYVFQKAVILYETITPWNKKVHVQSKQ